MPDRLPISLLVNTRNAGALLGDCIASCSGWVSETIVVDMESEDDTVAVAEASGARVIAVPNAGFAEPGRQVAIDAASQPWVLSLDADERAPRALRDLLAAYIAEDAVDGAYLPRRNWMFGRAIQGAGFWPDYQLRFFRPAKAQWPPFVHTAVTVAGRVEQAPATDDYAIVHHAYSTIAEFVDRTNRYTSFEIERMPAERRFSLARLLLAPPARVVHRFLWLRGYRDREHGLALSVLMAIYHAIVELKLWQRDRRRR